METLQQPDTVEGNDRLWRAVAWLIMLLLFAAFCLPLDRLTCVWHGGHKSSTGIFLALFCRSYHIAPFELQSLLLRVDVDEVYTSMFFWPYMVYALFAAVIGTSEAAIRLLMIGTCVGGGLLMLRMLSARGGRVMCCGAILYASAPLTLAFGEISVPLLLMGITMMIAVWAYAQYLVGKSGLTPFILAAILFAVTSTMVPPLVAALIFFVHLFHTRKLKSSIGVSLIIFLPWVIALGFHMGVVYSVLDSVDPFLARGVKRSTVSVLYDGKLHRALWKAWGERLGIPLILLSCIAVWRGFRLRTSDPLQFVFAVTGLGTGILYTIAFFESVSNHAYSFQLCMPTITLASAPVLASMFKSGRACRAFAVVLLLICLGLFAHRISRRNLPSSKEIAMADLSRKAGLSCSRDQKILLVMKSYRMEHHKRVLYYSKTRVHQVTWDESLDLKLSDYGAVIGPGMAPHLPAICRKLSLEPEEFTEIEGCLFWQQNSTPSPEAEQ